MVAIIVGCFIVCWTPFMVLLHGILDHTDIENWHLFLYSFIPATLNSCINPAIYAWKMTAFRSEFCKLLGCCCKQATVNSMSEEYPTSGAVEMKTIEIWFITKNTGTFNSIKKFNVNNCYMFAFWPVTFEENAEGALQTLICVICYIAA